MSTSFSKKTGAIALGLSAMLGAATLAQDPAGRPAAPARAANDQNILTVDDGKVDWIYKSDVSALREGVLDKMEITIGKEVRRGGSIGQLHKTLAELAVAKAKVAADGKAAKAKAEAQQELAFAVVARNERLRKKDPNLVSAEEMNKAEAELKVAVALIIEAQENQALARAELAIAQQSLDEHFIKAPFDGVVIEELKRPGESVRANEPVVRVGNLDKLRVFAFIPLDYVSRIGEETTVEFQPRVTGVRGGTMEIEQKRFVGKITFVDPQIQPISETAIRIYADFENPTKELKPGMQGSLTIRLNPAKPAAAGLVQPQPAPGVGPAAAASAELPPLPR